MKKFIAIIIALVLTLSATAAAECIAIGTCDATTREGWNITKSNIDSVSMWISDEEIGGWYSHISCCETFNDITVAFAVTLSDGTILSEEQIFDYLDYLMFSGKTLEDIVDADANAYGIIEGIFAGEDQIKEAIDMTIAIHETMEGGNF